MASQRAHTDTATKSKKSAPAGTSRGRLHWRRIVPVALLGLGIALWFAPPIAARASLTHWAVNYLFPAYSGDAVVDTAHLGWTRPISLRNVKLRDADGRVWMTVDELNTSKSLYGLIFDAAPDLGTVTLVRPELSVQIRENGSTFEDRLWEFLADDGTGEPSAVTIAIEDGSANWTDAQGNPAQGSLEHLNATIHQSATAPLPGPVEIAAQVTSGEETGSLRIDIEKPPENEARAEIVAENLPGEALVPWLGRLGVDFEAAGPISAELSATCSAEMDSPITLAGHVGGSQLRLWPAGSDPAGALMVDRVEISGRGAYDGRRIGLEQIVLDSPAARLEADGAIDPAALASSADWTTRIASLLSRDLSATCSLNLARLPSAISSSLPPGRRIESGRLRASFESGAGKAGRQGEFTVTTSDLVAALPERRVTWSAPFSMNLVVTDGQDGLSAKRIHAEGNFITLDGSLEAGGGQVEFDVNLDRLREELTQFMPIAQNALAGKASGTCEFQPASEPGWYNASATARLRDFAVNWAGGRWTERDLRAEGRAVVCATGDSAGDLKDLQFSLHGAEGDSLAITPIDAPKASAAGVWPVQVRLRGELARWITRLQSCSILPGQLGWSVSGVIDAGARILHRPAGTHVSDLQGTIENFQAAGGAIDFQEKQLAFGGALEYVPAESRISSRDLHLDGNAIGLEARSLEIPVAEGAPLRFEGTIRSNLAALSQAGIGRRFGIALAGNLSGPLTLVHGSGESRIQTRLAIQKPMVKRRLSAAPGQPAWRTLWSDGAASLALTGRHAAGEDAIHIETAVWKSQGATLEVSGQIQQASGRADAALEGNIAYDLALLRSRIPALGHADIKVAGKDRRSFSLSGPLRSSDGLLDPALTANAGLGWQSMALWGVPLGQGEVTGQLRNKQVVFATSKIPVAGGSAQTSGGMTIALPLTLGIRDGRVIDRVQLTPEMCRTWVAYAAPLLAGVTEAGGTFSLDLDRCAVPALNPSGVRAKATLAIQNAQAKPGPTARAMLKTVQQIQTITGGDVTQGGDVRMVAPRQNVRLTAANGRVHHDRFLVRLGDADGPVIQTSGSVGFDNSLDLVATIPLDRRWFNDEQAAELLGGQTLRVPIRGTFSKPIPDPRALQDLARRAAGRAAGSMLQKELGDQLGDDAGKVIDGLFGQ